MTIKDTVFSQDLPQNHPPRPFEDDSQQAMTLTMAAYGLRPPKQTADQDPPLTEADHAAGAASVASQVSSLCPQVTSMDATPFKKRLMGVIKQVRLTQ
ncbi:MAG: hypothetical protein H7839_15945 [Magnetococcus sp. YQC-5]